METVAATEPDWQPVFAWPLAGVSDRALVHLACVSALSVYIFYPNARRIFLLPAGEKDAFDCFVPSWAVGLAEVRELPVPAEFGSDLEKSRWIKTHSLMHLSCDALLLDADTMMVRPMDASHIRFESVAAARDRVAVDFVEFEYLDAAKQSFEMSGWTWPESANRKYFNSGVIAYRNTTAGRKFAEEWPKAWFDSLARTGRPYDQPAFNKVVAELNCCTELPVAYNAPVVILPSTAPTAKIYHYYSSGKRVEQLTVHAMGQLVGMSLSLPNATRKKMTKAVRDVRKPFVAIGVPSRAYQMAQQYDLFVAAKCIEIAHGVPSVVRAACLKTRSALRRGFARLPRLLQNLLRVSIGKSAK
jgi:hypothetical protein